MLTLVVARARDGAIGRDGTIPWTKPDDLRLFQRETLGGALIMGRRTWESLPVKPLKSRLNIVVSRDAGLAEHVCPSLEAAVGMARAAGYSRLYGIGGTSVYEGLLPVADRLLITEVDLEVDDADAVFPAFDEADWHELDRRALGGEGPDCTVRDLVRRR